MEIIFATNNSHKLKEAQEIIGECFTLIMPKDLGCNEDILETGVTLEDNSMQKCKYIKELFGKNCFADDTGLEVDSLDGAPGVYSARYAGEGKKFSDNIYKLLRELDKKEKEAGHSISRKAHFKTVVTLWYNGEYYIFEGKINGEISREIVGEGGFGYDSVFIPEGFSKTFAQMSDKEKNSISHRGIAIKKLSDFLCSLNAK